MMSNAAARVAAIIQRVYKAPPPTSLPAAASSTLSASSENVHLHLRESYTSRHTLSSLYIPKGQQAEVKQVDHEGRKKEREIIEIVQAARKLSLQEQKVRDNIVTLGLLLPDLQPNTDRMRASDWAKLVADVDKVAAALVILKTAYPSANVSRIIAKAPKVLLQPLETIRDNADKVKQILHEVESGEIDAIIEAVPYLMNPDALVQSLSNIRRWFNTETPIQMLRTNATMLLNIEEADLPADPLYGEVTVAG